MPKKKNAKEFNIAFATAVDNLSDIENIDTKVSWLKGFSNLASLENKHADDIIKALELTLSEDNDPKVRDASIEFGMAVIRKCAISKNDALNVLERLDSSSSDTYEKAHKAFSKVKQRSAEEDLHLLDTLWSTQPET